MDYPRCRRTGLEIASSPRESPIKPLDHRIKGTEVFWLQPEGAALDALSPEAPPGSKS